MEKYGKKKNRKNILRRVQKARYAIYIFMAFKINKYKKAPERKKNEKQKTDFANALLYKYKYIFIINLKLYKQLRI